MRRRIFSTFSLVVLGLGLMSCSKANISNTNISNTNISDTFSTSEVKDDLTLDEALLKELPANATLSGNASLEYNNFVTKYNVFSAKILDALNNRFKTNASNVMYSPKSIYMALAGLTVSASEDAREEILNVLGMTYSEVKTYTKYLYSISNNDCETLRNSVWLDDSYTINFSAVNDLSKYLYTETYNINFKKDSDLINQYIYNNTNGLIDSNIDFPEETILSLVNTTYFEDKWSFDYSTNGTRSYNFTNYDNSIVRKNLLISDYIGGKSYQTDTYSTFYINTKNGYKISFIKPQSGNDIYEVFNDEMISEVANLNYQSYTPYVSTETKDTYYHTRVLFPEFSASFDDDIKSVLEDLGITKVFDDTVKPLSNIVEEDAAVGFVKHQTKLDADKNGIKAAASTVVGITEAAATTQTKEREDIYYDYYIDKSFGYIIEDNRGEIVFSGIINNLKKD